MAGPDVGGSMGGHDPEKYGPIRTLVAHYGKMAHPFRACVRDNTKRFGPERVKRICAWVKDQARGTTKWRNTEHFHEAMRDEGYTEIEIDWMELEGFIEADAPEVDMGEVKEYAKMACEALGLDHDPDGHDEACPECGAWAPCNCKGHKSKMQEAGLAAHFRSLLEARPKAERDLGKASETPGLEDDLAAISKLRKQYPVQKGGAATDKTKKDPRATGTDDRHPREVARAENGTIVYDDGSVKDIRTNITRFPVQVFQDGSVRYDDGKVAKPGSLAALMVMMPMTKEDKAKLAVAGPKGLPLSEFASVAELINTAVSQLYDDAGVGGMGELASDQLAMQQGVPSNEQGPLAAPEMTGIAQGLGAQDYAGIVAQAGSADLQRRADSARGRGKSVTGPDRFKPVKIMRGEKVMRGPDGGRGVWRQVNGNPIFIKVGQSVAQAQAETRAKQGSGGGKQRG